MLTFRRNVEKWNVGRRVRDIGEKPYNNDKVDFKLLTLYKTSEQVNIKHIIMTYLKDKSRSSNEGCLAKQLIRLTAGEAVC